MRTMFLILVLLQWAAFAGLVVYFWRFERDWKRRFGDPWKT